MRIVVVAGAFAPNRFGSPAVLAEQTAIELRQRGHEVFVITAMAAHEAAASLNRWEVSGLPVIGIGVPSDGVQARVAQILAVLRPDVMHLHSSQYLGQAPALAALQWGGPTVFSDYGGSAGWPTTALAKAGLVLVAGPAQRNRTVRTGLDPSRVRVVPNGAAPPVPGWRRPEHPLPLRIGFLGGISQELGYDTVVSALTKLRRTDYELHVLDRATARGVRAIREWDFKVPGLVRFVPRFPPPGRDAFYGTIDVLLAMPSDPSSACLSVREALLRGVWPIASDVEGAAQVIVAGKNGTLVPPGSVDALAAAIGRTLDHPRELGGDGVAQVGIPTVADQVDALEGSYDQVMGRSV